VRKIILKCGLSLGDIVLLSAAVRDLHAWYPGQFITDVRTAFPELWENNPHLTPLGEEDRGAETIECSYPLIDFCNETPYHAIHGFIEFLNKRLRLEVKPTRFKGDIHLSEQERAWYSQVHEVTRQNIPFWIVAAGGKYDVTIKWWDTGRYQDVIDYFHGQIQFVQVGSCGHHHPKLNGVIDLRGQTTTRELIRLVHHSDGVLCSVTALMHLAAAVETRSKLPADRPCVVVAGGREPAHWEAYPGHQFIHTNGALSCCLAGGCWKDRTFPLRDGDERDHNRHLCTDVIGHLPRCMEMISAQEVIRRIQLYYANGARKYLTTRQQVAAGRGVSATVENRFDLEPLNLHNAGFSCDQYVRSISPYPERRVTNGHNGHVPSASGASGGANKRGDHRFTQFGVNRTDKTKQIDFRGIVICGGGKRYFTCAWVCINMLRDLGCTLPIELWHLGKTEMDVAMVSLVEPLGVRCIDALEVRQHFPMRRLGGWELKPYTMLHTSFRELLLLDADNVPVVNPEFLFETDGFKQTGAIFWPDYPNANDPRADVIWRSCGLPRPKEPEFESGQIVLDKERCWAALNLAVWFNAHSDFYYQHLHGDKETFHIAFRKLRKRYTLVSHGVKNLQGVMCQHDFDGRRIFQHRNSDKWNFPLRNKRIRGFKFEDECRAHIRRLQGLWDGTIQGPNKSFRFPVQLTLNHR
jgi:ADP-heptose:LPS heptosyltransferase